MKRIGFLFALGLLSLGASTAALAHTRVIVGVGGPVWGYGGYGYQPPPPYYYYPAPAPVVVMPPAPPVTYIEAAPPVQQAAPAPSGASNMWYHCSKPEGYYPYVKQCPGGWRPVEPQPPTN